MGTSLKEMLHPGAYGNDVLQTMRVFSLLQSVDFILLITPVNTFSKVT
jgi:hypothetical protein